MLVNIAHEVDRDLKRLGCFEKLVFTHRNDLSNLRIHLAHVADGLNDVPGSRLSLGANHRCAFGNAPQRFAQVPSAADKGHTKLRLVDVVSVVSRREHFGFIDVVNVDGLKNLRFDKMTDTALGHHGNGNSLFDALDHRRVTHTRNAARGTNIGRNTLQGHDGTGAGAFGNFGLLGGRHIHNDAAL